MAELRSNAATLVPEPGGQDANTDVGEDLKEQYALLKTENEKLRRMAQYRSVFLARLAHELRTPLTSVLGFAEILLNQEELTEPQRGFCERIQNSAQQLQNNLNQLADLSRLEAGQSSLFLEEFSLGDLLRESCAAVTRPPQKQNVEIRCQSAAGLAPIVSDRGKLRQVIHNFLIHAIVRSNDGAGVTATSQTDAQGFLLEIEDEGESVPNPSTIGQLESTDRRSGASDLGLVIARHNLDLLGANLHVENRQPHGLRVRIQLPESPPEMPLD